MATRQPTSTAGSTSGKKSGTERPVKPASSPVDRISTANWPKPCDSHSRASVPVDGGLRLLRDPVAAGHSDEDGTEG